MATVPKKRGITCDIIDFSHVKAVHTRVTLCWKSQQWANAQNGKPERRMRVGNCLHSNTALTKHGCKSQGVLRCGKFAITFVAAS